jgi:hypothetical protein
MQSPFATPGTPAPGTFDPTKIAQQMQTDPNVRTMFAQFFGDPASRQFVQDSGNVVDAMARPDNPWTPGQPIVPTTTGPSTATAPSPGASSVAPGASLASREPGSVDTPTSGVSPSPVGPSFAPNSFSSQGAEVPGRPVGPMDNVHGARKALMLAFLGLNKFGAGLAHQQDSYADEFFGNQMRTEQQQREYDANQPLLRQQAANALYAQNLGFRQKEAEIEQTGAQTGFTQAQTGNLALNPPGKAEFLKEFQDRLRAGADDPQALAKEYLARAPYNHVTPQDLDAVVKSTQAEAPSFKIGEQGIAQPLRYGGKLWSVNQNAKPDPKTNAYAPGTSLVNEPGAPPEVQQAALEAKTVQDRVQANKVQAQGAARSNIVLGSELGQQKEGRDKLLAEDLSLSDSQQRHDQLTNAVDLAQKGNVIEAQNAVLKTLGLSLDGITKRINTTELAKFEDAGSAGQQIAGKLRGWTQGNPFPDSIWNDVKAFADEQQQEAQKKHDRNVSVISKRYGVEPTSSPAAGAPGANQQSATDPFARFGGKARQ